MTWAQVLSGAVSPVSILLVLLSAETTLIGFGLRLFFRGQIVARTSMEDTLRSADRQVAREREISELQKTANDNLVTAVKRQTEQIEFLVREQQLVKDVMLSLRAVGESNRRESPTEGKVA